MALTTLQEQESKSLTPQNLQFLCKTVYSESGIVLDESKRYLIEARLLPVAKIEGATSLDGLCNLVRATRGTGSVKRWSRP